MTLRPRREGGLLPRTTQLAAVLRSSREALCDLEGQLDALLTTLRDSALAPDAGAAERLHGAARQAGSALASLSTLALPRRK
jgi:hypothetical protein